MPPFKAIAVDMDGTFLDNKGKFNQLEFKQIMLALKQKQIHFIVSSGNELQRCKNDMNEFAYNCDYVCENGSYVVSNGVEIYQHFLPKNIVVRVLKILNTNYSEAQIILSAKSHAYILKNEGSAFKKEVHHAYPTCIEIEDLFKCSELDHIFKITLGISEDKIKKIEKCFNEQNNSHIYGVSGGGPWMDLINSGDDKAFGLKKLLDYLKISSSQLIAFGDGGNDLKMLKFAGISYAMSNGIPKTKDVAKYIAPRNDEDGVFTVLSEYLL